MRPVELVSALQVNFTYPSISNSALKLGDYEMAQDYLLRANPVFESDTLNSVDRRNVRAAIMLAHILKQTGDDGRSRDLLAQADLVVRDMHRIGFGGHGISDVHIFAIQGRVDAALDALRDAVDDGFVSLISYDFWTLEQDPLIDGLRDDARFEAIQQELRQKIDIMHDNVERADELDDWRPLLDPARGELTAA